MCQQGHASALVVAHVQQAHRLRRAQTYLEQNGGPGLQHLALKTDNIFATLREMRARTDQGGFDFMPRASPDYYRYVERRRA